MPGRFIIAALLAATPLAGYAQDRDIDSEPSLGKIVAGEVPEGGAPARFLLTLEAGQAIDLTAAPVAGSDPVVRVYDTTDDSLMAENDDSAGGLAANVRLYSETRKRVRIEVGNAALEGSDAAMRFDLILRPSDWRPRPPVALTLGQDHRGTLARGDEQLFAIRGMRGQRWDLTLVAAPGSGLDPAVQVFAGDVVAGAALGSDDDGGGGLNSRLRFRVPEDGNYTIRVYAIGTSEGAYALTTAGATAVAAVALRDIELGRAATGTLELGSDEQVFRLSSRARAAIARGGGTLVIDLRRAGESTVEYDSAADAAEAAAEEATLAVDAAAQGGLDPVLDVGFDTPLGFSSLLNDDDGGENGNSRLTLDASNLSATWLEALRIKASSFLETTGDYELTVSVEE